MVNTTELIREIVKKLSRYRLLLVVGGLGFATLLFFYARSKRPVYTAKATLFPLTNASDNSISSSALSGILGLNDAPKSFSNEATINIIELTLSRHVREEVALERLPQFGNKTITQLLVEDANEHRGFLDKAIEMPQDSVSIERLGSEMIKPYLNAKMSKNGVLELYITNSNKAMVTPLANVIISKLSQFYIDLKIKKATSDYEFAVQKIDSLQRMLSLIDRKAVGMQNTTFFTPDRLEYDLPKENLTMEKERVLRQRDMSVNNREEATWRLQKATPIIAVLDQPTEPFAIEKPSSLVYGAVGFVLGCMIAAFILVAGLIYRFIKSEVYRSIYGNTVPDAVSVAS